MQTKLMLLCPVLLSIAAQEIAVPVKPIVRTVTSFRIIGYYQERDPDWRFTIKWRDSNGDVFTDTHYGVTLQNNPNGPPTIRPEGADVFIKQMNTANFSTVSFERRLMEHLEKHGKIPAFTVTGEVEK